MPMIASGVYLHEYPPASYEDTVILRSYLSMGRQVGVFERESWERRRCLANYAKIADMTRALECRLGKRVVIDADEYSRTLYVSIWNSVQL